MNELIKKQISLLPDKPGSYQMIDKDNNIIYIGKAKNLKKRVSQYFLRPQSGKTFAMVQNVDHFTFIITSTEKEALILEMNLIKKYLPKYNILLTDDSHYPYIAINKSNKDPHILITRNTNNKKLTYFGPFPNGESLKNTLMIINKLFKLRKCKQVKKTPCLYYHLGQCFAPCINKISSETYEEEIGKIEKFLNGDISSIKNVLLKKINDFASNLDFESANEYKKIYDSLLKTVEKQKMEFKNNVNADLIAFATRDNYISVTFFVYRQGKLNLKRSFVYEIIGDLIEFSLEIINQYYSLNLIPKNLYVLSPELKERLENQYLESKVYCPKKGKYYECLLLVQNNALKSIDEHFLTARLNDDNLKILEKLGGILHIKTPYRIELFDNSHLQGTNAIGAVVTFINGEPYKKMYRTFNIQSYNKKDDLSSMREVLFRRYSRIKKEGGKFPDLIILDGGKTQLEIGKEVLNTLEIDIPIASLFKNDDHRTNGLLDSNFHEYLLNEDKDLFFMLTRMQDEVHRFAISTHKNKRNKNMFKSVFDEIKGIGPKKKELLTKRFPTINELKSAKLEELEEILPKKEAKILFEKLQSYVL